MASEEFVSKHGGRIEEIENREDNDYIPKISPYTAVVSEKIFELREMINKIFVNSRERSLALMKLDECKLWLTECSEIDPVVYPPAGS